MSPPKAGRQHVHPSSPQHFEWREAIAPVNGVAETVPEENPSPGIQLAKRRRSWLAKVMTSCAIITILTLALGGANEEAQLRKRAIAEEITALFNSDAAAHAVLTRSLSPMKCMNARSTFSCQQSFSGGDIYWSEKTGAHYIAAGPLHTDWLATGGADGPYGLPTENPRALAGTGTSQDFAAGSLVYSPANGTHSLEGAIRSKWMASGAADGPLGFPTSSETLVGNGRTQRFQKGAIYLSPSGEAYTTVSGAIERRYVELSGPAGPLGFPSGEEVITGSSRVQQFSNGYLVQGPTTGARIMDPGTYKAWSEHREFFNWPVKDSWSDARGIHTEFQKTETIWDAQTQALYSTDNLDEKTAIIIGDSQLGGDSWTEQGARAAGFTKKIELGFGGWGYTRSTAATRGTPDGLLTSHRMLLPQGKPGAIFLTLGGNDASAHAKDADIVAHATKTWAELRRLYPETPIIVNGVMSTDAPNHVGRRHVDKVLMQAAKDQGLTHVSVAVMATVARSRYIDNVHLTQDGQNLVATPYTTALLQALHQ